MKVAGNAGTHDDEQKHGIAQRHVTTVIGKRFRLAPSALAQLNGVNRRAAFRASLSVDGPAKVISTGRARNIFTRKN